MDPIAHWQSRGLCSNASEHCFCTPRWPSEFQSGRNTLAHLGRWQQVCKTKVRMFRVSEKRLRLPPKANQGILPTDYFRTHVGFAARSQAPTTRTESLVQDSAVLDFWKINHAILKSTFRQQRQKSRHPLKTRTRFHFDIQRVDCSLKYFSHLWGKWLG